MSFEALAASQTGGGRPHDPDAEQAVLGSVLKNASVMSRVQLEPDAFYDKRNGAVWASMVALYERYVPIDYQTLADELRRRKWNFDVDPIAYLAGIDLGMPTAAYVEHYAAIVDRLAFQRRLMKAAYKIYHLAKEPAEDQVKLLNEAEGLFQEARPRLAGLDLASPEEWAQHFQQDLEMRTSGKRTATPLPWANLQYMTAGGLEPGELVLVMATSGSGKTEVAFQVAAHATQWGPVVYATLEQTDVELGQRYARLHKGLSASALARGELSAAESDDALEVINKITEDDLWPVSPPGPFTTVDLRARCQEVQARTGRKLALVVADYAQRFADSAGRKSSNREQDMALVAERLKSLARELHVPVLVPIQPNRAYESRPDKRPRMADLRESGRFEIEADWILGIYRPDKHEESEREKVASARAVGRTYWPLTEVWVLKNRSGRGDTDGMRELRWTGTKYVDPEEG